MPKVPVYDGPQVREAPLQGGYQQQVDVTRDTRALASGLEQVAGALSFKQQRDDQDAAFATDAKLKTEWLDFENKLRAQRKGRDAATYDTEVEAWWKDAAGRYGKDLSPGAQRLVGRSLTTSQVQAVASAKNYKEQQLNASAAGSYTAAQSVSVNEAATVGNEAAVIKARADMDQKRMERARLEGWTPEQVEADKLSWSTTLHSVMVQKLTRTDPTTAQVYYDKYKGEIGAQQQAAIESHLAQTSAVVDGSAAAGAIWQEMGPKNDGQPVELDKMMGAAREKFAKDPTRLQAAMSDIQARAVAFNAAERERTAGKVNTLMAQYSQGATLTQLQRSPEFQSLPGTERARIQEHITDRNHMLWSQSIEDRARLERMQQQKAAPAFLEYSNPEALATMSRQQVQALLPSLGQQYTEHLVQKWDALQKPQAKIEARIDADDFNHVADKLGLSPYKATTEDKKRQLGELRFRVEQMINQAQVAKKGPLTREEKMELMTGEMARTVTVDPLFGFKKEVPVIQLSADQLKSVVVPEDKRMVISEKMKARYVATQDPRFAPSEENLRYWYLTSQSRAADLLPQPK